MVLPERDLRAAEKYILHEVSTQYVTHLFIRCIYLASPGFSVLLLDLNLHYIARMLNDLGDERLMFSANFSQYSLEQVDNPAVQPILPEASGPGAERCHVRLDHTESTMYRPE